MHRTRTEIAGTEPILREEEEHESNPAISCQWNLSDNGSQSRRATRELRRRTNVCRTPSELL